MARPRVSRFVESRRFCHGLKMSHWVFSRHLIARFCDELLSRVSDHVFKSSIEQGTCRDTNDPVDPAYATMKAIRANQGFSDH